MYQNNFQMQKQYKMLLSHGIHFIVFDVYKDHAKKLLKLNFKTNPPVNIP